MATGNWSSFLERPLILVPLMAEPEFALNIGNNPAQTSEGLAIGFNMGVIDKLQAGAAITFPVNPNADFGSFLVNAQYGVLDFANARLDLGATKYSAGMTSSTGFSFGIGLPLKYKLAPMFAVTSGSQYSTAFGSDIFYLTAVSGATIWSFGVPIGILVQPHEMIALQARSGFRIVKVGDLDAAKYVPVGVDLFVNIIQMIDVFFTFELPGNTDAYSDERDFVIGARARFGGGK